MAISEQKKDNSKDEKKIAKKSDNMFVADGSGIAFKVLIEPWITEKSHAGIQNNRYTFKINRTATKSQVKKAIEGVYKVKVEKITTVNIKPKKKFYGRHVGKKSGFRKATVKLKKGDSIELFKGA